MYALSLWQIFHTQKPSFYGLCSGSAGGDCGDLRARFADGCCERVPRNTVCEANVGLWCCCVLAVGALSAYGFDHVPATVPQDLAGPEVGFVLHLGAVGYPITQMQIRQVPAPGLCDLPKNGVGTIRGGGRLVGVKGVNSRERLRQTVDDGHDFEYACRVAKLRQKRIDMAAEDEVTVFLLAVVASRTAVMALLLVLLVKGVMLGVKGQRQQAHLQRAVLFDGAALAAVGLKVIHQHTQRQTACACGATGAVGDQTAAAKTLFNQLCVNGRCSFFWRVHQLHACFSIRQIVAGMGVGGVQMQPLVGRGRRAG